MTTRMAAVPFLAVAMVSFSLLAHAAKHKLVVGTFSTEFVYTLEYDDQTRTLTQVARNSVPAASSWLTPNVITGPSLQGLYVHIY